MHRNREIFVRELLEASRLGYLREKVVSFDPSCDITDADIVQVLRQAREHRRAQCANLEGSFNWDFDPRDIPEWTPTVVVDMLRELVHEFTRVWWDDPKTKDQMYAGDAHAGTLMQAGNLFIKCTVLAFINALVGGQPDFATAYGKIDLQG